MFARVRFDSENGDAPMPARPETDRRADKDKWPFALRALRYRRSDNGVNRSGGAGALAGVRRQAAALSRRSTGEGAGTPRRYRERYAVWPRYR